MSSLTIEKLKSLKAGLPLSPEQRETFDAILVTPEVAAIVNRDAEATFKNRQAASEQLQGLPRSMKPRLDRAVKELNESSEALRRATEMLTAARAREESARIALIGLDIAAQAEAARLEHFLDDTADTRLQQLIDQCHVLLQSTRDVTWSLSWKQGSHWDGRPIMGFDTNLEQVTSARAEIGRVIGEAQALKRKVMSRREVTEALKGLLLDLEAAVVPFDLSVMRLGDLGELVVDAYGSSRELADRARAASQRAADVGTAGA